MQRFLHDESGMTMGVVIILVVLIGVMGAGLLTFASTDLESVIETNRGQRAMEAADIGVDAARRHLSVEDAMPASYDATVTADNSAWYDDSTPKVLNFDGNQVRVGIRYLNPHANPAQVRDPNYAPEVLPTYPNDACNDLNGDGVDDDFNLPGADADACDYPNNRNYYRVTVRGGSGEAVRQVQAIFVAENFEFPVAYYATRDIQISGSSTKVNNLSLFANRHIRGIEGPKSASDSGTVTGTDLAYGNWAKNPYTNLDNPYNRVPRIAMPGKLVTADRAAGAAALGETSGSPCTGTSNGGLTYLSLDNTRQKAQTASTPLQAYGYRDYDRDSDVKCSPGGTYTRPDFGANTWGTRANQPDGSITFPFAVGDAAADAEIIAALKEKAQAQGLYRRVDPDVDGNDFEISDSGRGDDPSYPFDSELTETVMFIEFADGTDDAPVFAGVEKGHVDYTANGDNNVVEGTIVVVNGDFNTSPSTKSAFQGAIIVRDPDDTDNALAPTTINCNGNDGIMDFCNEGRFDIEGFVNVEGDIALSGNVDGILPAEMATGLPGLFRVSQWSWRECYNTTCD